MAAKLIEHGVQGIPQESCENINSHVPLWELEVQQDHRSSVSTRVRAKDVYFPFSNDGDLAIYYKQLRARQYTPDYQNAINPVAVIIGEGSLAAALQYIPEPTIILIDKDPFMVDYMRQYRSMLRVCEAPEDFLNGLGISLNKRSVYRNVRKWRRYEESHPFESLEKFRESSMLAKRKAIVPYCLDITDPRQMLEFGELLNRFSAEISFMNLTNAAGYENNFLTASDLAHELSLLPITQHAPIMTTSPTSIPYYKDGLVPVDAIGGLIYQTGPFFGVDNLRDHGDFISASNRSNNCDVGYEGLSDGALFMRQYVD
jgi:hypothetical protein